MTTSLTSVAHSSLNDANKLFGNVLQNSFEHSRTLSMTVSVVISIQTFANVWRLGRLSLEEWYAWYTFYLWSSIAHRRSHYQMVSTWRNEEHKTNVPNGSFYDWLWLIDMSNFMNGCRSYQNAVARELLAMLQIDLVVTNTHMSNIRISRIKRQALLQKQCETN